MDRQLPVFCFLEIPMDRIIETTRLHLRQLRREDAETIATLINNYEIAKNLARVPHPYELADAHAFLDWLETSKTKSRFSAICMKPDPETLQGIISYEWSEGKQNVELGYWLVQQHWGKGLMTEAAIAMVDHAFLVAGVDEMVSGHFHENPASGKVLVRAGFKVVASAMLYSNARHTEMPTNEMRLRRADWQNKNATKF